MGWRDRIKKEDQEEATSGWRSRIQKEDTQKEEPSELEALARGGIQGVPFVGPFTDEIGGGAQAAWDTLTGDQKKSFMDLYRQHRDEIRQGNKEAQEAHPYYYGGAQVGSALLTAPLTGGTSIANLALQGAAQGLGGSDQDLTTGDPEAYLDTAKNTAIGAGTGAVIGKISQQIGKIISPKVANDLTENATGATGVQASKFQPNAGLQLQEMGLSGIGDTQEDILNKVTQAHANAGRNISDALNELDSQGGKFSYENVVNAIQSKINDLKTYSGNESLIKELEKELENIYARGESQTTLNLGEMGKRVFQNKANYKDLASPQVTRDADKILANIFRKETERGALEVNPSIAEKFIEEKKLSQLLAPIKEAAEKRAATTKQSPFGGLLDVSSMMGGFATGHPVAGIAAPLVRRYVAPRSASTVAGIIYKLNKAGQNQYVNLLNQAAQRGATSVAATHFILQQTDPQYHAIVNEEGEENENQ